MTSPNKLSNHILPTSATMVGVCMTVIGIIALTKRAGLGTYVDELLACDSAIFLLSVASSYLSIRSPRLAARLESVSDALFLLGLATMVVAAFVLSLKLI
jgi:hypothetical protein